MGRYINHMLSLGKPGHTKSGHTGALLESKVCANACGRTSCLICQLVTAKQGLAVTSDLQPRSPNPILLHLSF